MYHSEVFDGGFERLFFVRCLMVACFGSECMKKKILISLFSAFLLTGSVFAEEVAAVVRYGVFGSANAIFNGHAADASGDFGAGVSFEYGMPFYAWGKQNGLKLSLSYNPLMDVKHPVTEGTDVDFLIGYWVRFPFGLSDFAFQPEIDYGIAFKYVTSGTTTACTMDPKLLVGLSFRWNSLNFAKGNLEFEATPLFGVETSPANSLYVGGRFALHFVIGNNALTLERVAEREGKMVDSLQAVIQSEPILKDSVSVYRSNEGVTVCFDSIDFLPDSYEIDESDYRQLDKIIRVLRKYDNKILVTGHCDMVIPDEAPVEKKSEENVPENDEDSEDSDEGYEDEAVVEEKEEIDPYVELSQKRAQVVADYLIDRGLRDASEIYVEGKGASQPRGDNNTEYGRKRNRRIEITLMRKI